MKVILLEDVKKLGIKDEIVEVSSGYANNYLIPRKLAILASDAALKEVAIRKEKLKEREAIEVEEARKTASQIEGKEFIIKVKTGEKGKLFGAVSNIDIATAISKELNIEVDRKKIILEENIKLLGSYPVELRVYPGVIAKFLIKIEGM